MTVLVNWDDWPENEDGYGLPNGWGVYPAGPGYAPPTAPEHAERCEAAIPLRDVQVLVRCLLARGHDGIHVTHP